MTRICTVCARAGSKGVKGKNLRPIGGLPLIAHSLRQALQSGLFEVIAVSSDSAEILDTARKHGATELIERPAELATDTAAKLPVIRHAVEQIEMRLRTRFDTCVDLDATSPLRSADDIRDAVQLLESSPGATNVITAMPARRSPYFNMVERRTDGSIGLSKPADPPFVRRQDAPACFDMNASIYVWTRAALVSDTPLFNAGTRLHVMPEERSIDIDSDLDFLFVDFLMNRWASPSA